MGPVTEIFSNLTQAQADVISSAVTLLSAIFVAIIAPLTFHLLTRGGVKGFNDAVATLKTAADRAQTQSDTIGSTLSKVSQVSNAVKELGVLLASVQEALANTQNTLLEERAAGGLNGEIAANEAPKEKVKALWRLLQERVEQAASNPEIHGGTRARYARMDRRSYWLLIEALLNEGKLLGDSEKWRKAYLKGTGARTRSDVSIEDVREMEGLERALRDTVPETLPEPPQPTLPGVVAIPSTVSPSQSFRSRVDRTPRRPESGQNLAN